MKNEWKDLLNDAFYAPDPKNKEDFLKSIRPREVSTFEMIWEQAAYIRIPVWIFSAMIVIFAVYGSVMGLETTENTITMIMPFTAAIAVIEAKRSGRCGMTEMEMATRFSLRSVVFARMVVLGVVAFIILCVSSPVIAIAFHEGTVLTAVRILIPYLVTMIISLRIERNSIGRKVGYSSLAIAVVVAILIYWVTNFEPRIVLCYMEILESWGILIALGLLVLTMMEQWKTMNNVEEFA